MHGLRHLQEPARRIARGKDAGHVCLHLLIHFQIYTVEKNSEFLGNRRAARRAEGDEYAADGKRRAAREDDALDPALALDGSEPFRMHEKPCRHMRGRRLAIRQKMHLRRVRQERRSFCQRIVARAEDGGLLAAIEESVADRAVAHAVPFQLLES